MSRDLLSDARERAEQAEPAIKVAALVSIARVVAKTDDAEAERILEHALTVADTLPAEMRAVVLEESVAIVATVSPTRALEIKRGLPPGHDPSSTLDLMLSNMIRHGHLEAAATYLSDPIAGEHYPFGPAIEVIGSRTGEEASLRVLRSAMRAVREEWTSGRPDHMRGRDSTRLFTFHWKRLPADEARAFVRELVQRILSEPDTRMTSGFGSDVRFSSTHETRLFEILAPLRHLDPDLVVSVTSRYPDLAAAADRFPYGQESIRAALHAKHGEPPPLPRDAVTRARERAKQPDFVEVGGHLMPIDEAIRTEFKDALAIALHEYATDSDPDNFNEALQDLWPSAMQFRNILYKAGQHEGAAAARYLDRIPDLALRLYSQIELCAALAGLPQLGGRSRRTGPRRLREREAAMRARPDALPPMPVPEPPAPLPPPRKPKLPASRELRITPATMSAGEDIVGGAGRDYLEIRNVPLKALISYLYDVPETRIEWLASCDPDGRYDFVLVLPQAETRDDVISLVQDGITRHFSIRIASELRSRDVYVLTAPNGIKARLIPKLLSNDRGSFFGGMMAHASAEVFGSFEVGTADEAGLWGGKIRVPAEIRLGEILDMLSAPRTPEAFAAMERRAKRQLGALFAPRTWIAGINASMSIEELCETLEGGLNHQVVDETHLPGTYAIDVQADPPTSPIDHPRSASDFLQTLDHKLGLVTRRERREVLTLVVAN